MIAINQGLDVVGVLGILVENYKRNHISFEEAHYYFNLFKKSGLRVNNKLEEIILQKLKVKSLTRPLFLVFL